MTIDEIKRFEFELETLLNKHDVSLKVRGEKLLMHPQLNPGAPHEMLLDTQFQNHGINTRVQLFIIPDPYTS